MLEESRDVSSHVNKTSTQCWVFVEQTLSTVAQGSIIIPTRSLMSTVPLSALLEIVWPVVNIRIIWLKSGNTAIRLNLYFTSNFHSVEVVDRASGAQLQKIKKLNIIAGRSQGLFNISYLRGGLHIWSEKDGQANLGPWWRLIVDIWRRENQDRWDLVYSRDVSEITSISVIPTRSERNLAGVRHI